MASAAASQSGAFCGRGEAYSTRSATPPARPLSLRVPRGTSVKLRIWSGIFCYFFCATHQIRESGCRDLSHHTLVYLDLVNPAEQAQFQQAETFCPSGPRMSLLMPKAQIYALFLALHIRKQDDCKRQQHIYDV